MTAQDPQTGEVLLSVRNVTKYFPVGSTFKRMQLRAVSDVSFDLRRGNVLALVGESGSGKSTAARCVARLIEPSGGEIWFRGQNILQTEKNSASLEYRGDVQMIFQDPFGSLNPVKTIDHTLRRSLQIHKKAHRGKDATDKIRGLLDSVGLAPADQYVNKYPYELSGGQRQRVSFARALAVEP